MHYIVYAPDKPNSLERRMEVRPRHLAYWNDAPIKTVVAGPMLDEETGDLKGSMLILEADDMATVRKYAEADPYWLEGVFEKLEINRVRLILGELAQETP